MLKKIFPHLFYSIHLFAIAFPSAVYANANPEDTLPKIEGVNKNPTTSSKPVEIEASERELELKKEEFLSKELLVKSFDIQGVSAIPNEEVNAIFQPNLNKTLSIKEIINLANTVTKIYNQKGYPLSFAYIPKQSFQNNEVTVLVIEGFVRSISIKGDFGPTENKIRSIVEPMLKERPLTQSTMERCNSLLSLLPGLNISASLQLPKTRDGASELVINALRIPIAGGVNFESIRPRARAIISVQTNSQTESAEQFTFSTLASQNDEEYYSAAYAQMLGSDGVMLNARGTMYQGDSEEGNDTIRNVRSLRFSTSLSYPFLINKTSSLIGTVGFSAINFEDRLQGESTFRNIIQKTNSRAVSIGAQYSTLGKSQSRQLQLTLSKGLNLFGSSKSIKTNFDTNQQFENVDDLNFSKANFNLSQKNTYSKGFGSSIALLGQYTEDNLPISERVIFGGYQYGRAFSPGFFSGDSGWGLALEMNKRWLTTYDLSSQVKLTSIQPYVLFESARTFQNLKIAGNLENEELTSLAFGVRLYSDPLGVFDMSVAKALSYESNRDAEDGLTFSLNYGVSLN